MTRKIFAKAIRIGRATMFTVGTAVTLALVFRVATVSGPVLQVVNNNAGTALDLRVGSSTTTPADKTSPP